MLEKLIADFPDFDARILVEDEDEHEADLGPNPKIRNMSRAYREAKHDVIWIVDCNVWVGTGVARRMVDRLCGFGIGGRRVAGYRFVHQLPIVVATYKKGLRPLPGSLSSESKLERMYKRVEKIGGSRLEEMFMATSHAKMYTGINTLNFAPCVAGKSTMFRPSDLNTSTLAASSSKPPGIDFFSHNICEDVLIGTMLFEKKFFEGKEGGVRRGNGLLEGDFAIQPVANMAVSDYVKRRMRWQRVRKFTPLMATLVEPGTESLVCSALGAFGITSLPILSGSSGVPQDWKAFVMIWTMGVLIWFAVDWLVYTKLLSCASVEIDINAPDFAMLPSKQLRRPFWEWTATWMCRELLALPIWLISFFGGSTVIWRSKTFRIRPDGVVQELT